MSNKTFIERVKKECGISMLNLPSNINFEFKFNNGNSFIQVTLGSSAVTSNMQTDSAAFEGWVILILAMYNKIDKQISVLVDIDENYETKGEKEYKHYNRFLYRLNKFAEQFEKQVKISENLCKHIDEFYIKGKYEKQKNIRLVINKPDEKEAGYNSHLESVVETYFGSNSKELRSKTESKLSNSISNITLRGNANRQLPVGVFSTTVSSDNSIFTGGKSAIDLWTLSDDNSTLCIYELKFNNAKVGIITELFFYANLMNDFYCEKSNNFVAEKGGVGSSVRGYEQISDNIGKIKRVAAFFLTDKLQSRIAENLSGVLNLLNSNKYGILYENIQYEIEKIERINIK